MPRSGIGRPRTGRCAGGADRPGAGMRLYGNHHWRAAAYAALHGASRRKAIQEAFHLMYATTELHGRELEMLLERLTRGRVAR